MHSSARRIQPCQSKTGSRQHTHNEEYGLATEPAIGDHRRKHFARGSNEQVVRRAQSRWILLRKESSSLERFAFAPVNGMRPVHARSATSIRDSDHAIQLFCIAIASKLKYPDRFSMSEASLSAAALKLMGLCMSHVEEPRNSTTKGLKSESQGPRSAHTRL